MPSAQTSAATTDGEPPHDCPLCPRLVAYRDANRALHPDWHNAPVPGLGDDSAPLLIVGMAPGVAGANRTGQVFTGDDSGRLLYSTLARFGLAEGEYTGEAGTGPRLLGCRIVNAVRCVPPANLPEPVETRTCNRFLTGDLQVMHRLRIVLALGVLAHAAVLRACGIPAARVRFRHGAVHTLPDGLLLANSFHVSRYNTSTGKLTEAMFEEVVADIVGRLGPDGPGQGQLAA